jgi:alkylation response protein AidB-like acyl-CoA dehydrogenase
MDFELSNEMKMLADMAYKFAVQEVEPVAKIADEEEKYTPDIRKKAGANGLIGCWIPE